MGPVTRQINFEIIKIIHNKYSAVCSLLLSITNTPTNSIRFLCFSYCSNLLSNLTINKNQLIFFWFFYSKNRIIIIVSLNTMGRMRYLETGWLDHHQMDVNNLNLQLKPIYLTLYCICQSSYIQLASILTV